MWGDQIEAFAPKHRIIAVDLRGHGESDKPDQDYDIAGFADDMAWLIREIGLDRPVLIGHSMGGVTTLNLAAQAPGHRTRRRLRRRRHHAGPGRDAAAR